MERFLMKIKNEDKDLYFEWSTVVDAPVTEAMEYGAFLIYIGRTYGRIDVNRLMRLQYKGTSSLIDNSAEDVLRSSQEFIITDDGTEMDDSPERDALLRKWVLDIILE